MTDNIETTTEAPVKRGRGRPKKVVVETTPEMLTEVPPVTEESELLTEVPPVIKDSPELITEVPPGVTEGELLAGIPPFDSSEEVLSETPGCQPDPMTLIVGHTPQVVEAEEKPHSSPHYSAAQIKKLRSAYSRRTLLTRFGISW